MEQKQASFETQLAFGQEGEHEVAQWLIGSGVTVLPLYQFESDKAPVFISIFGKAISPDLICFGKKAFMAEVKTKNQWVVYGDRIETGFNLRHYNEYKSIQDLTNTEVFVFFNQKKKEPLGIYYAKLDAYTRIWNGQAKGKRVYNEMVFYSIDVLKKIT
jgi:hypothetical protein